MTDPVDQLRDALNVATDIALAAELGVERSTVAQWRRRHSLPARYQAILDAQERADSRLVSLASRRLVYGDGLAMYALRAALSVIPTAALDFPALAPALLGDHRERLLLNVARFVLNVTPAVLGKPRCENERDYDRLVSALLSDEYQVQLHLALTAPTLGEHL